MCVFEHSHHVGEYFSPHVTVLVVADPPVVYIAKRAALHSMHVVALFSPVVPFVVNVT